MKKSKLSIIFNILFFVFIIVVIIYNEQISNFIVNKYIYNKDKKIEITKNDYSLNRDYKFVQITNDFVAKDYPHLLNIIYTILDSGEDEAYFFCSDEYSNCLSDIDKIIPSEKNDNSLDILSDINNMVHPYNSYKKLTVVMNSYGKVIIKVNKQYNNNQINYINTEVDKIIKENIPDNLSTTDKIKTFHDYIINTTKYDKERANDMFNKEYDNSDSHTANGLLKNHLALCGGYSDIMSIYLSKLDIPNMRISADKHVWNLVYLDNRWLHIDSTWDDPVTNTGSQILLHDYFLIDSNALLKADTKEHNYNKNIYLEAH